MKVLITAPGNVITQKLLPELFAPEFSVRIIAPNPYQLPEAVRQQAEIIRGSMEDADLLRRALEEVEAMFWVFPRESVQERNIPAHYERFARVAATVVREAGTPRVVAISAWDKGPGKNADRFDRLRATEDILNQSGAAIRHVRQAWLMENFLTKIHSIEHRGLISYPVAGDIPVPMTAAADVADVALRWLARRNWADVEGACVHGPEDLTFTGAAAVFERVLHRPVRYEEISPERHIQTLVDSGASNEYAQEEIAMFGQFAARSAEEKGNGIQSNAPTTLDAWARSELLPLLAPITPQIAPGSNSASFRPMADPPQSSRFQFRNLAMSP